MKKHIVFSGLLASGVLSLALVFAISPTANAQTATTPVVCPAGLICTPNGSLTVSVVGFGTGHGTVTGVGLNLNCGAVCTASVPADSQITLIATPDPGSKFVGWSGDACAGSILPIPTCTFNPEPSAIMIATFYPTTGLSDSPIVAHPNILSALPLINPNTARVDITLSWSDQNIPASRIYGIYRYVYGSKSPIYQLIGSTTHLTYTDSVLNTAAKYSYIVRASDSLNSYSSGQSDVVGVTISAASNTLSTPTHVFASVSGSQVTLTWNPSTGSVSGYHLYRNGTLIQNKVLSPYTFTTERSSGGDIFAVEAFDITGNVSPRSEWSAPVRVIVPVSVTAEVSATVTQTIVAGNKPILTLIKSGDGDGGIATGAGDTLYSCPGSCSISLSYTAGTHVTIIPKPSSGSTFTGWSGGGCFGPNPCTITLSTNTSVTGSFAHVAAIGVAVKGGWSAWIPQDTQCGHSGTQTRSCTNPPRANGGADCSGPSTQSYANVACQLSTTPTNTSSNDYTSSSNSYQSSASRTSPATAVTTSIPDSSTVPNITFVSPPSGHYGDTITITGTGFNPNRDPSNANIGNIVHWSDSNNNGSGIWGIQSNGTTITTTVPNLSPGKSFIVVQTCTTVTTCPEATSNSFPFTITSGVVSKATPADSQSLLAGIWQAIKGLFGDHGQ